MTEVVVGGQREVTRPAAAVEQFNRPAERCQIGIGQRMREVLQKFIDLNELGPHGRLNPAIGRGDSQHFQEPIGFSFRQWIILDAIVAFRRVQRRRTTRTTDLNQALFGYSQVKRFGFEIDVNAGESAGEE